jgi:hypothetical protein
MYQQAFDNVKAAIQKEVVLTYPDFLMHFEVYTDAFSTQLGAVIAQDSSVTEIDLAIVETLKEFKSMLCGADDLSL